MAEENSVESRATTMGWLPKDQFRGNPDNWVPAETFVRLAEESLPHAKGTIKMMEKKMAQQSAMIQEQTDKLSSLQNDMAEFVAFSKGAEQRAYDKALRELKAKQIKAKEDGDMPAFVDATEEIDSMIKEHPSVTGKDRPAAAVEKPKSVDEQHRAWINAEPSAFPDWKAENDWYEEDPDMFAYANQMDSFLNQKYGFTIKQSERLAKITDLVKKKFPDKFGNPARRAGSPVEGDTGGPASGNNGHSYHNLPPEAKAQCDKWAGKDGKGTGTIGKGFTREDFLKSYKW